MGCTVTARMSPRSGRMRAFHHSSLSALQRRVRHALACGQHGMAQTLIERYEHRQRRQDLLSCLMRLLLALHRRDCVAGPTLVLRAALLLENHGGMEAGVRARLEQQLAEVLGSAPANPHIAVTLDELVARLRPAA